MSISTKDLAALAAELAREGINDLRVLEAIRSVPRAAFVPQAEKIFSTENRPLPIGSGQTISQPWIVARMAEAARLGPGDHALEIGTGSGYGAAILSRLCRRVDTVERLPELATAARRRLAAMGYANIAVHVGDGTEGLAASAPYEAIVVTAGGPSVPPPLKDQLALGGRLIMPVGPDPAWQDLVRVVRVASNRFEEENLGKVAFVPLIGAHGFPEGKP